MVRTSHYSMDRSVTPRKISTTKSSAPVRCRVGGRTPDDTLTVRSRRVSRLEVALGDAKENSGYSPYCTPRRVHQQLQGVTGNAEINDAVVDHLQYVYDRVEQRNNLSGPSPAPMLSSTQHQLAEEAVHVFVNEMRCVADTVDAQDKFNLERALANDILALQGNSDSRYLRPLSKDRNQTHGAESMNQLDDVTSWYYVGKEIGRGTFGRVRLGHHRLSGTPVAIKSYARLHGARSCLAVDAIEKRAIGDSCGGALEWRRVRQEVSVLSRLRAHPNIMRFVEGFETPTRIHAVTELVQGTNLCDILRRAPGQRLTEIRAKLIFRQLAAAVEALHTQCVIHRDLKLENVLLDESSGHATVIDFGFSDFEKTNELQTTDPADNNPPKKQSKKKNFCGTPSYMAPEVVVSERYDGRPVDVWSLAVLLYVMLVGKFPFQGVSFHQLYQRLRSGAHQLMLPPVLSVDVRALLQSMLTVDPAKRPSASELCCCSWLQDTESPQLISLQPRIELSFESWSGTKQAICMVLTELYGIRLNHLDFDRSKTGHRQHKRLSAFINLATAVTCYHFQRIVAALPSANSSSSDDIESQQPEETNSKANESPKSGLGIDVSSSTHHKQQLEKLIGLVKTSLVTN